MQLRNKKTGEIIELLAKLSFVKRNDDYLQSEVNTFNSLAELNEEWEDYEEPKEYWYIDYEGGILVGETDNSPAEKMMKSIGNHFNTLSEAEKAVEKLKAWKRLKNKGFRFTGFTHKDRGRLDELEIYCHLGERPEDIEGMEDVHLLFGGEE